LNKLTKGAEIIGKGNLDYKTNIKTTDEIGQLSKVFDQMTSELKKSQTRLKEYSVGLEKEVEKRTQQLDVKLKESEQSKLATINMMEDITEAKEELKKSYEELKGLDKLKTQFLNITSHELRTPVTPIKIQIGLLLESYFGKITEKQKKSLTMILRNTRRLDALIADILDISKIQGGNLKLELEKTDLAYCIKESVETVKTFAVKKNISITTKIGKLPKFKFDKNRIIQVLTNLINNATKFTPENGKITIEAEMQKNNILIKVKDTGIGLAEKNLKSVFKPFFQIIPSYKIRDKGTGLGLSICKGIIEQHGGKIWIESKLGKGSTFYFTLPLK